MLKERVDELAAIVGSENISAEPLQLEVYSRDPTVIRGTADVVVWPRSVEAVSKIMNFANKTKIPVYPRGAGSSLCGGPVPTRRGIVLSLERMNRILEVDVDNLQFLAEAGVSIREINDRLRPHGLFIPPDPASEVACTIGGCVANNAGGIHAVKYGTFRDWVLGLEVVLPTGEIVSTGTKTRKSVSGYDLTGLITGSEGTLAVITKIRAKMTTLPESQMVTTVYFDSPEDAGRASFSIMIKGLNPSAMELLDETTMGTISRYLTMRLPQAGAMLIIEFDGHRDDVDKKIAAAEVICREEGAVEIKTPATEKESLELWNARKTAFQSLAVLGKTSILIEDVTVPISRIPEMLRRIHEIAQRHGILVPTFGHVGDGNLHPHVLYDEENKEEYEKAMAATDDIFRTAVELGGTISGEHGIGVLKRKYFALEHSQLETEVMKRIKKLFDPNNILNPHKIFPEEE
ncbi:FAD-binding protein [Candidatus Bathyarchaeota archaeon]|nr:FAD-binding protein [Candidatus Bathyarchaeota archaeon]